MKKIKFGAQIFLLAASFPLIFLSGITQHTKKVDHPEVQVKDSTIVKRSMLKKECICQVDNADYKGIFINTMMKY